MSLKLPSGEAYAYDYDPGSRLVRRKDPGGTVVEYAYDPTGNVKKTQYASGPATELQYNPSGQVTGVLSNNGERINYSYDLSGNLTSVSGNGITQSNTYDSAGRVVTTTVSLPTLVPKTFSYTYDSQGNQTSVTDPFGRTVLRTFNSLGQLTKVSDPELGTFTFEYDVLGQMTRASFPNGTVTNITRDAKGRPLKITLKGILGISLWELAFNYDQSGRLAKTTDPLATAQFVQDADGQLRSAAIQYLNPLIAALRNHEYLYSYDSTGNRLRFEVKTPSPFAQPFLPGFRDPKDQVPELQWPVVVDYTYGSASRLASETARRADGSQIYQASYEYDDAGSMSKKNVLLSGNSAVKQTAYTHSVIGKRLEGVVFPDGQTNAFLSLGNTVYRYKDAQGRIKHFLYDGRQIAYELDSLGKPLRRYIYGAGIDEVLGSVFYYPTPPTEEEMESGSEDQSDWDSLLRRKLYFHLDQAKSVYMVTNSLAIPVAFYRYEPFGRVTDYFFLGLRKNTLNFHGRPYIRDLGFYDFRARLLDPRLGRFVEGDPVSLESKNDFQDGDYTYVRNAPLLLTDPLGLGIGPKYGNHCGDGRGDRYMVKEAVLGNLQPDEQLTAVQIAQLAASSPAGIDCTDRACKRHDYCRHKARKKGQGAGTLAYASCDATACAEIDYCFVTGQCKTKGSIAFATSMSTTVCSPLFQSGEALVSAIADGIKALGGLFKKG